MLDGFALGFVYLDFVLLCHVCFYYVRFGVLGTGSVWLRLAAFLTRPDLGLLYALLVLSMASRVDTASCLKLGGGVIFGGSR